MLDDGNNIERRRSIADLKHDYLTVRRVGAIAQQCSDKLYTGDEDIPIEDIEILSVVIEEFIDTFQNLLIRPNAMLEATEMKRRKKSLSLDFSCPMLYLLMTTQGRKTYSLIF